jgi:type III secretion protein D
MTDKFLDAPRLVVESGVHRLASCDIAPGNTTVGSGPGNAIIVSDLAVGVGFTLLRDKDGLSLRAAGARLEVGGRPLRPGQRHRCTRTVELASGGIRFRLDVPPAIRPKQRSMLRAGMFAAGAIAAVSLAATILLHSPTIASLSLFPGAPALASNPVPAVAAPISTVATAAAPSLTNVLDGLRRRAAAAGLQTLTFEARPDGSIVADGRIAPAQGDAWHQVGGWFDTAAQGRFVLVDAVQATAEAPALQIQAVWPGHEPYVVDGSGQKLFIGSLLPNGWTIQDIDRQRILIKRDAQTVAVRF